MGLALFLVLLCGAAAAYDLTELSRRARESVVLLRLYDTGGESGSGTGFSVADGLLVTNLHVVDGASRVKAVLANGDEHDVAGVIVSDEDSDLALLRLDSLSLPSLPLAAAAPSEAGEEVVVYGFPLGLSGTISEGIVSAIHKDGLTIDGKKVRDQPLLRITAAISLGSSGSPVMNLNGEVIGVVVSLISGGQSLNCAIPVEAVSALLAKADASRLERKLGSGLSAGTLTYVRNLAISVVFFLALFLGLRFLRDR